MKAECSSEVRGVGDFPEETPPGRGWRQKRTRGDKAMGLARLGQLCRPGQSALHCGLRLLVCQDGATDMLVF